MTQNDAPLIGAKPSHGLACGECACWVPIIGGDNKGTCMLNPPTPYPLIGQNMAGQPAIGGMIAMRVQTSADDWCAQHTVDLGDATEFLTS